MLKLGSIPEPHSRKDIEPDNIFDHIVSQNNFDLLIKYMAVFRMWNGEYVKQNSYNREISYWLSNKKSLNDSSKINELIEAENDIGMNYIEIAEKIIAQEQVSRITEKITLLEAIRHIKIKPDKNLSYYTSRLI